MIYRGFDIVHESDGYWWTNDEKVGVGPFATDEAAMNSIDAYKRKQFAEKEG